MRFERLGRPLDAHALSELYADDPYLCLLENPGTPTALGRYAFLAVNPFHVFHSKRDDCFSGPPGDVRKLEGAEPLEALRRLLRHYGGRGGTQAERTLWQSGMPPFIGGAVGYLGYELLYLIEDIPDLGRDDFAVPDSYLLFCDTVFATDLIEGQSWVFTHGFGASPEEAGQRADEALRNAMQKLNALASAANTNASDTNSDARAKLRAARAEILERRPRLQEGHLADLGVKPVLTREQYLDVVQKAREHIFAGDCFEVCTTQRFDCAAPSDTRTLYRVLRSVNEAPFAAYLRFPEVEVASSSPERFMQLDRDGWAQTRPIKGTRPRGRTPEQDAALIEDLKTCEKDLAENIMIVDLARNDLGRVSRFGSVQVPELRIVETYPFTHQMVSTVRGQLREGLDAIDLLRASFPGGSMTGAPKVESMKIIDALEPVKRGIFSGSIGYFDFDGSFDLSIVIRTLIQKGDRITFHVGGAVVADSDPAEEYQETLDKAHGLVLAMELARKESK